MRRSRFVTGQVILIFAVACLVIWSYYNRLALVRMPLGKEVVETSSTDSSNVVTGGQKQGSAENYSHASASITAVLNSSYTDTTRLECPATSLSRYEYLKTSNKFESGRTLEFFFALDLRQSFHVLPRLLGSVVETVRFLGPSACALSIVEGNSDDGTFEMLDLLRPEFEKIGLKYIFQSSQVNPKQGDRVSKLAELRNMALEPLVSGSTGLEADGDTTIVFLNDVAICMEDILELIHQRTFQAADMTCAMDWTYVGENPTFYDVWVARTLTGDSFFRIPADGSWDWAWNLFWNDPAAKQRFDQRMPFQVFACWNGATAFTAAPVLGLPPPPSPPPRSHTDEHKGLEQLSTGEAMDRGRVSFRAAREGECYMGEPTLFCKDMWWAGFGRIAVVPSVNLEYSDKAGRKIKEEKGYTSKWVEQEETKNTMIAWSQGPPAQIKCMPQWENQHWVPWNETLK
ncbi:cryptococcal mannosyltransferase 1-domain-containing protein [Xylariales sp. PMI_506]|nr:cryptococcal mannosyltransferase 1-domain-containing protein [Xylariales sp. PMI_506]